MMHSPTFPEIKVKPEDLDGLEQAKWLKHDLKKLKKDIMEYAPSDFNYEKLNRLRIRIFKFCRKEGCNEFFTPVGNKKYVCLNASLLNRKYHAALAYMLHGIGHSFCHLRDDVAEEAFCELVSYSILNKFLKNKGKNFSRRVIRGIMNKSPPNYNIYYRAARNLEKKRQGMMLKLNSGAKNRKISKKNVRKIFYKLMKFGRLEKDSSFDKIPELERGFKKI